MRHGVRRGCALLGVVLLLASVLIFGTAAKTTLPEPTDRFFVNDFADVLNEDAENTIYAAGVQLYQKTGAQVVAVTIPSLDGADPETYSLQLARQWGIGNSEKDNGVLLLLAVEDREVRIEVGYGLEGAITDARSGILLDNYAIPAFSENDFQTGMADTYDAIVNEVYLEYGMEADPDYVPADELEGGVSPIEIVAILVILVIFFLLCRNPRFLLFFGGPRHRHGSFFVNGGFNGHGGGFSGGGFSGGGGSFGGGGASRKF